jgi:hypothetical protein
MSLNGSFSHFTDGCCTCNTVCSLKIADILNEHVLIDISFLQNACSNMFLLQTHERKTFLIRQNYKQNQSIFRWWEIHWERSAKLWPAIQLVCNCTLLYLHSAGLFISWKQSKLSRKCRNGSSPSKFNMSLPVIALLGDEIQCNRKTNVYHGSSST